MIFVIKLPKEFSGIIHNGIFNEIIGEFSEVIISIFSIRIPIEIDKVVPRNSRRHSELPLSPASKIYVYIKFSKFVYFDQFLLSPLRIYVVEGPGL